MSSLARAAMTDVASVSAGPPWGGLYLKPPSAGGLCDGVTTMPSASPVAPGALPRLARRIACETAGVGVKPSRSSTSTCTPLATSTSRAERQAGSDRPCVSRPMKSGPSKPCETR